jgi:predicted anti-sigma-YlaC factor YlaD
LFTYKKRARVSAIFMALTSTAVVIFGVFLWSWQMISVGALAGLGTAIYAFGSERAHRGEP